MNPDVLRRSYDRFAHRYDADFRAQQQPKIEALLAALPVPVPTPWLDVGAGTGLVARLSGGRPINLDLSAGMLGHAPPPRVQADAHRLPFPDATFRCVTAVTALIDLVDPTPALAELVRVLRPGGWLAISVLVREQPARFVDALAGLPVTPARRLALDRDAGLVMRRTPVDGDPPM
ncbi:MAG: methyltransferase domain-containing protein [Myxococcales bacterium]|nr:methyltransferase domain-containing protein [Myxococcales bacterium]